MNNLIRSNFVPSTVLSEKNPFPLMSVVNDPNFAGLIWNNEDINAQRLRVDLQRGRKHTVNMGGEKDPNVG